MKKKDIIKLLYDLEGEWKRAGDIIVLLEENVLTEEDYNKIIDILNEESKKVQSEKSKKKMYKIKDKMIDLRNQEKDVIEKEQKEAYELLDMI